MMEMMTMMTKIGKLDICSNFKFGNKSLDVRYLVYIFIVMWMAILLQIISFKLIEQMNKIVAQKSVIDSLTSKTQTTSVVSSLNTAYSYQK